MNIAFKISALFLLFCFSIQLLLSQEGAYEKQGSAVTHNLDFSGQASVWGQFSPDISTKVWLGGRYIPQLNYGLGFSNGHLIDLELSGNFFGDLGLNSLEDVEADGKIKPYRAWARYSNKSMEVRFGLQKINFGSAQMFRPLMWFDTMDPRDPLQLTDGVWGGLFRYYFHNNANVWLWTLYGNKEVKGWEFAPSARSFPEIGGRAQLPLRQGEIALSYHYREANYFDTFAALGVPLSFKDVPEHRIGFDVRLDRVIGMWLEGSWTHLTENMNGLSNQAMFTLGGDYTFGIGNGLGLTFEQLFYTYGEKMYCLDDNMYFSGLMLSYPVTMSDNLSTMFYYNWKSNDFYSFLNWQHQFNELVLHAIAYWNPQHTALPGQMGSERFYGKGIQLMLVWNH